jgi:hypothetical protein
MDTMTAAKTPPKEIVWIAVTDDSMAATMP